MPASASLTIVVGISLNSLKSKRDCQLDVLINEINAFKPERVDVDVSRTIVNFRSKLYGMNMARKANLLPTMIPRSFLISKVMNLLSKALREKERKRNAPLALYRTSSMQQDCQ